MSQTAQTAGLRVIEPTLMLPPQHPRFMRHPPGEAGLALCRLPPFDEAADQQSNDCDEVQLAGEHLDDREGVTHWSRGGEVAKARRREHGEAEVDPVPLRAAGVLREVRGGINVSDEA